MVVRSNVNSAISVRRLETANAGLNNASIEKGAARITSTVRKHSPT